MWKKLFGISKNYDGRKKTIKNYGVRTWIYGWITLINCIKTVFSLMIYKDGIELYRSRNNGFYVVLD